jgi:uncharacterized protein YkwD
MREFRRGVVVVLALALLGLVTPDLAGAEERAGLEATTANVVEEPAADPLVTYEFRPNANITRAATARMLHQIAGTPAPGAGCGGMTDVPVWAEDAICWLVNTGHASGYPDNTFLPLTRITRGAVARMLHQIAGTPAAGAGCGGMTDVPDWAHTAICWLINNDYASGYAVSVTRTAPSSQETASTLVNSSRTARGLRALRISGTLNAKAQAWSAYLARIGRLEHSNLASGVPSNWRALAENVGYAGTIRSVHDAYMNSSGHRANILGNYTHLGTGVTVKGNRVYVVHVFMRV